MAEAWEIGYKVGAEFAERFRRSVFGPMLAKGMSPIECAAYFWQIWLQTEIPTNFARYLRETHNLEPSFPDVYEFTWGWHEAVADVIMRAFAP